jgi:hypothetical protein
MPGSLSRRTLLRGAGAALALPWLDAMASAGGGAAARTKPPVRMAALYFPNGVLPQTWTPAGRGRNFELTETLKPLAAVKNDVNVLTNLWNRAADSGDGHYVKSAAWLCGTTIAKTTGSDVRSNGVSMDQLAAQKIGHFTRLPSLELGTEPVNTGVDVLVGYTRLYGAHIAWSSPTTPVAKEINPRLAFDRLFRTGSGEAAGSPDDASVLDLVKEDAARLRKTVGVGDRHKLDEYLESVRSIERRIAFEGERRTEQYYSDPAALAEIEKFDKRLVDFTKDPGRLRERGLDHSEHVRLMLDLMVLAFWTDSTRIATFMFGNDVSNKNFSFLPGVRGSHHEMSHHENDKSKMEQYKLINIWHVQQYAYLLERLKSVKEGESNLLDQSMILMGASIRDGNAHDPHNLPVLIGGKGGGALPGGRHLVYKPNTPLCNLFRSMLKTVGAPSASFADSTGELAGFSDANAAGDA